MLASSGSDHAAPAAGEGRSVWLPLGFPFLAAFRPPHHSIETPSGQPPAPASPRPRKPRYLIIVEPGEAGLCEHLKQQFAGDPAVHVVPDRRHRRRGPPFAPFCAIVEAASRDEAMAGPHYSFDAPSPEGERRGYMEGLEDRQRVDRWIEESQYLIGRMIPGLLDDRDRLKGKFEAAEQECAKLRQEIGELRKEVSDLQSETQFFRTEHVAMADALREVIDHVGQIQKPLNEVYRRLQVTQPAFTGA